MKTNQKIVVDVTHLNISNFDGLADKVKAIIASVLIANGRSDMNQAIQASFESSYAREILCENADAEAQRSEIIYEKVLIQEGNMPVKFRLVKTDSGIYQLTAKCESDYTNVEKSINLSQLPFKEEHITDETFGHHLRFTMKNGQITKLGLDKQLQIATSGSLSRHNLAK